MTASPPDPDRTPLIITCAVDTDRERMCEPVTCGIPLPRGLVRDAARLTLADADGQPVPVQVLPTEHWADGSLRWVLVDFQVTGPAAPERRYTFGVGAATASLPIERLTIDNGPGHILIDTGAARFLLQPGIAFPFTHVTVGGLAPLDAAMSALLVEPAAGQRQPARTTALSIEEHGELRTTVRVEGAVGPERRPWLTLVARIEFFAGSSAVRMRVTLRNPRRAHHRDGFWELGDPGSFLVREVSLHLALPAPAATVACAPEAGAPSAVLATPVELYQDSSGGVNWRHVTHVNRNGEIPITFRGYRLETASTTTPGLRATPVVVVRHEYGSVGIAVERFWQRCPKTLAVEPRRLTYGLFPRRFADVHELQGGEQTTECFTLMFGDDDSARDARVWGRQPARISATPSWYAASGAVPHLVPAAEDADPRYQRLIGAAVEGDDSFEAKREAADEYGWRHFGDLYADHENAFSGATEPIVSHYNNQYDAVHGLACQFMRTGDDRWYRLMTDLAAHVYDIDIYHTDGDKSAYNGGLFWHSAHYVAAGRSSHRTYPRDPRVGGGGPSNEHNYTAGLRMHWLLTGDRQSREAAIGLARWVITMDDGWRTVLRWLASGDTGLASQTFSPGFQGPGRGAGHSILALLDGHRLTHEDTFLAKAEQLIRRCIHPSDDIAALTLLDAERRWSYTVFLQALGKYLDYKVELQQIDAGYAYARAALLHYARWMAEHEYPYLNKPEILEYPTETWSAQDMRKCEVFLFAAGHAAGAARERFLERARFFFDDALTALARSATRTLTRPLVLLLSNGFMFLSSHAADARPEPPAIATRDFGAPTVFVPQKARARQRIVIAAALMVVIALAVTLALV